MKPSARGSEMNRSRGNGQPSICSKSFQLIPGGSQYSCLHNHSSISSMLQVDRIANMNMTMTYANFSINQTLWWRRWWWASQHWGGVGFLIEFMLTKILALSRWALMLNSGGEKTPVRCLQKEWGLEMSRKIPIRLNYIRIHYIHYIITF